MSTTVTIQLPYPPTVNTYWRHRVIMTRGRAIPSVYVTREGKSYKLNAKLLVRSCGVSMMRGPVNLSLVAYRPRKLGDIDNILKCVLDSLSGALYDDDSQVVDLHVRLGDDKTNPRVVVIASEA